MRIAQYVANCVAAGSSLNAVAKHLGTDHRTVRAALEFNRQWPDEARRYASDEAHEQFKEAKYRIRPQLRKQSLKASESAVATEASYHRKSTPRSKTALTPVKPSAVSCER